MAGQTPDIDRMYTGQRPDAHRTPYRSRTWHRT